MQQRAAAGRATHETRTEALNRGGRVHVLQHAVLGAGRQIHRALAADAMMQRRARVLQRQVRQNVEAGGVETAGPVLRQTRLLQQLTVGSVCSEQSATGR